MFLPELISGFTTLALSVLILIAPWFHGLTGLREQLMAQSAIFVFAILVSAALFAYKDSWCRPTFLDRGIPWILALTAVSLTYSVLPLYSLMTWVRFLSVITLYGLARLALKTKPARRIIVCVFLIMGTFYSIYGLCQYYGPIPKDYWYTSFSLASRYVNGGHFAGLLVMPFFLAGIQLVKTRNAAFKLLFFILLILFAGVLLLTRSRTVWISLASGFSGFLFSVFRWDQLRKRGILIIIPLGCLLAAAFFKTGLLHIFTARFTELHGSGGWNLFSILHRFYFWEASIKAVSARPWGWGLGTFVHIMPQFKIQSDRFILDYAHNELCQLGVDLGLLGLLGVCYLFLRYLRLISAVLKKMRTSGTGRGVELSGLFWCVLVLITASQFDFPLRIYGTALFAAILFAYQAVLIEEETAVSVSEQAPLPAAKSSGVKKAFSLAVLAAGIFLSGSHLAAQEALLHGMTLEGDFKWDEAMTKYRQAVHFAPWYADVYEAPARLAQKRMNLSLNPEVRKSWMEQTLFFYKGAARSDAYWPANFYWMGRLYQTMKAEDLAGPSFLRAFELQPTSDLYLEAYAYWQLRQGHLKTALELLEKFQRLSLHEQSSLSTEKILEDVYPYTQDLRDLLRLLKPLWNDRYTLGMFLSRHGRWQEGVSQLTQALESAKLEMTFDSYMTNLGQGLAGFYVQNGRLQDAAAIYREAAQKHPENQMYKQKMEEILRMQVK